MSWSNDCSNWIIKLTYLTNNAVLIYRYSALRWWTIEGKLSSILVVNFHRINNERKYDVPVYYLNLFKLSKIKSKNIRLRQRESTTMYIIIQQQISFVTNTVFLNCYITRVQCIWKIEKYVNIRLCIKAYTYRFFFIEIVFLFSNIYLW